MDKEEIIIQLVENLAKYTINRQNAKNNALVQYIDNKTSTYLGNEIYAVVKKHLNVVSAKSLANGLPGGTFIAVTALVTSTWKMYSEINKIIGIPFSENFVKTIASGIVANLASNAVGLGLSATLSAIPGFGNAAASVGGIVINRASVYSAAVAYLKLLNRLVEMGKELNERNMNSELSYCGVSTETILHKTIGTLGHVDHGKTTLSAAITLQLAKHGLAEFKSFRQIDNAVEEHTCCAQMYTSRVEYQTYSFSYSHIDCPGHADYVKNIVTGTVRLDGAILVVAATDGPMPQTREHILLARLVGVPRLVVFLNKCDLVDDEELIDLIEFDIRDLLDKYDFDADNTPIIRGSALGALNDDPEWIPQIYELMDACDTWIPAPQRAIDKPFLMPIEDVFSIPGHGTVATGRIETGVIHVGNPVDILGMGAEKLKSVVTGVEMFRKILDEGEAGDNAGLLLRGIDMDEIRRGMVIAKPGSVKPYSHFKGQVYVLSKDEGGRHTPFRNKYRPQFYFRTTDVTGEITLPDGMEMVRPGDHVTIDVQLIAEIAMDKGLRFYIREGGRVVGVGQVIETY